MSAWPFLALTLLSQNLPGRAVVLPVKLEVPTELGAPLAQVERSFVEALRRLLPESLVTYRELEESAGREVARQLEGCTDSSCLTDLADALQAAVVITARVRAVADSLVMEAVLMDRRTAAVRRGEATARGVGSLLQAVPDVARALARGAAYSLEDPTLATRLGTDAAGLAALRARMQAHPDESVTRAWTAVLLDRNTRPARASVLQGATLVAAAGMLGLTTVTLAPWVALSMAATFYSGPLGGAYYQARTNPTPEGADADINRSYPFPWLATLAVGAVGVTGLLTLAAVLVSGGAWLVTTVRARLRHVKVDAQGCCRDDRVLRRAEVPGVAEQLGTRLGAAGAIGLAVPPAVAVVLAAGLVGVTLYGMVVVGPPESVPFGPATTMPAQYHVLLSGLVSLGAMYGGMALGLLAAAAGALVAVGLVMQEGNRVVDAE